MFSERDPLQITEKKVGLIHSCVNLVSVSVFAPCSSEKGACLFRNPTLLFFFFTPEGIIDETRAGWTRLCGAVR